MTTVPGFEYVVTTSSSCTVTDDATGKELVTAYAGQQAVFQAISESVTLSDPDATVKARRRPFESAPGEALSLTGGSALPKGYTRLDFLESTGAQYIDTGLKIPIDSTVELVAQYTEHHTTHQALFGWRTLNGATALMAWVTNALNPPHFYAVINASEPSIVLASETLEQFRLKYEYGRVQFNDVVKTVATPTPVEPTETFGLFGARRNSAAYCRSKARIWSARIADSAGNKYEFVPVLDPAGEPRMFDTVTKTSFRNAGSGSFVAGMTLNQVRALRLPAGGGELTLALPHEASIDRLAQAALERARANGWTLTLRYAEAEVPAGYRRLDFLESTGTQWIDTRVKLSNESEVRCEFMEIDKTPSTSTLYGNETNQNARFSAFLKVGTSGTTPRWDFASEMVSYKKQLETLTKYQSVHNATGVMLNGLQIINFASAETFETGASLTLFSMHGSYSIKGSIYSLSISRAGVAQVDYVPCIAPNGKVGMYNRVDGTMKENAGSGAFIAGLATVDDVRKLWLPEINGELTISVPADTPDSVEKQLRKNNPTWQIAIQYRTDNEN